MFITENEGCVARSYVQPMLGPQVMKMFMID